MTQSPRNLHAIATQSLRNLQLHRNRFDFSASATKFFSFIIGGGGGVTMANIQLEFKLVNMENCRLFANWCKFFSLSLFFVYKLNEPTK